MSDKILVTGGAGFIGSWLCRILSEQGKNVLAFDDLSTGDASNLKDLENVELIQGDICKDTDLKKIPWHSVKECYHLAAKGDVQESIDNPLLYSHVNIMGTHYVLEYCRQFKLSTLFMSTCMVYGFENYESRLAEGINEKFPTLPISPYGASKLAGEQIAISYHHSYDMSVKIARPFNTYGPYQKTNNREGGVIPLFLERKRLGKPLVVFGQGTQSRDFLYARDCAEFLVSFMRAKNAPLILNAGSDSTITINDLANTISSETGSVIHEPHPHPQSEIHCLLCDSSLARKSLGWKPQISLEDGIKENFSWLMNQV